MTTKIWSVDATETNDNYQDSQIIVCARLVVERFSNGDWSRIFVYAECVIAAGQEIRQHWMQVNIGGGDLH